MAMTEKFVITTTTTVKKCDDGGYVGIVKELPIVVQSNTVDELKEKIAGGLAAYIVHHQDEFAEHISLKTTT